MEKPIEAYDSSVLINSYVLGEAPEEEDKIYSELQSRGIDISKIYDAVNSLLTIIGETLDNVRQIT